jgi:hypothetical protein
MFRMEHEDQTLFLHCPDSIGPGSEVTLYREKVNMRSLPLFSGREEAEALIPGVTSMVTVASDGNIRYREPGNLQKRRYPVEWVGQFKKGEDLKVNYVEGTSSVKERATIGGEVRLANGSIFKNPKTRLKVTDQRPWIFDENSVVGVCCCFEKDLEEKGIAHPKSVQRRLMMRDPRDGFEDQCVGWVAPRADVERTEAALKSAEDRNCRQAVAAGCCCPFYMLCWCSLRVCR